MEWSNRMALQLIDEYEKLPLLWEAKHQHHFSRSKKCDAWEVISKNLGVDVNQVKRKMLSLLGSFRREKAKGKKSVGTGKASMKIYRSKWFAFERMHFLLDKDEPRTTINTQNEDHENRESTFEKNSCSFETTDKEDQDSELHLSQGESSVVGGTFVSPETPKAKKRIRSDKEDARLDDAYRTLKETITFKNDQPDACTIYSQYVANKLRGYSTRTRVQVEHAINNILFEADMGKYVNPHPFPPSQIYHTSVPAMHYPIRSHQFDTHAFQTTPSPLPSPATSDGSSTCVH